MKFEYGTMILYRKVVNYEYLYGNYVCVYGSLVLV